MAMTDVARGAAGKVYADFIRDQIEAQDHYKDSIEGRAMAVIASSSTIAGLLFAFAAVINSGAVPTDLPRLAAAGLAASLSMFVFAAAAALFVNAPRKYEGPVADDLAKLLDQSWRTAETPEAAAHSVAGARINMLRTAKLNNGKKADALTWAIGFEFGAIAGLALAVIAAFMRW
jgi:hypothetical protein